MVRRAVLWGRSSGGWAASGGAAGCLASGGLRPPVLQRPFQKNCKRQGPSKLTSQSAKTIGLSADASWRTTRASPKRKERDNSKTQLYATELYAMERGTQLERGILRHTLGNTTSAPRTTQLKRRNSAYATLRSKCDMFDRYGYATTSTLSSVSIGSVRPGSGL